MVEQLFEYIASTGLDDMHLFYIVADALLVSTIVYSIGIIIEWLFKTKNSNLFSIIGQVGCLLSLAALSFICVSKVIILFNTPI